MTTDRMSRQLRALARLHGIQTSYFNVQHARVAVADSTLRELLAAMGTSVNTLEDLEAARHDAVLRLWQRAIEPVIVAWDGLMPRFEVRTEAGETLSPHVEIDREDGTTRTFDPGDLHVWSQGFTRLRPHLDARHQPVPRHDDRFDGSLRHAKGSGMSGSRKVLGSVDGRAHGGKECPEGAVSDGDTRVLHVEVGSLNAVQSRQCAQLAAGPVCGHGADSRTCMMPLSGTVSHSGRLFIS